MVTQDIERIAIPESAPARSWPHLIATSGDEAGLVFRLENGMTVGRGPHADIFLRVGTVSRRHALVRFAGEKVLMEDLGARNGIFVGLKRIGAPTEIHEGDYITIGDVTLLKATWLPSVGGPVEKARVAKAGRNTAKAPSTPRFIDQLRAEHSFARRYSLSLVICFFRALGLPPNEDGPAREDAMRRTAAIVREGMQDDDLIARIDDDELIVLFRGYPERAADMAERVRARIERHVVPTPRAPLPAAVTATLVPLAPAALLAPETIVIGARAVSRAATKNTEAGRIATLSASALSAHLVL